MSLNLSAGLNALLGQVVPDFKTDGRSQDDQDFQATKDMQATSSKQASETSDVGATPLISLGGGLNFIDKGRVGMKVSEEMDRANWDGATMETASAAVARLQGWILKSFGEKSSDALDYAKEQLEKTSRSEGQSPQMRHVAELMLKAW